LGSGQLTPRQVDFFFVGLTVTVDLGRRSRRSTRGSSCQRKPLQVPGGPGCMYSSICTCTCTSISPVRYPGWATDRNAPLPDATASVRVHRWFRAFCSWSYSAPRSYGLKEETHRVMRDSSAGTRFARAIIPKVNNSSVRFVLMISYIRECIADPSNNED
jgi:hypothetical protein